MRKISHYHHLKNTWLAKREKLQRQLVTKHQDVAASDRLKQHLIGGLMLASTPFLSATASAAGLQLPVPVPTPVEKHAPGITREKLIELLTSKLPQQVVPLTPDQEKDIAETLSQQVGIPIVPELNGIRLNRSYGLIGQEQHLPRFPGDSLAVHFTSSQEAHTYAKYGMTPGRGAWGYFVNSQHQLSGEDVLREKYYIAVPTFLAPGWSEHAKEYKEFFKYRKMLVVNPENGKAIVCDIADAGPAPFTGKHLGGSPEVMKYLERSDGAQRGQVLYFFVVNDTIPLGPVNL